MSGVRAAAKTVGHPPIAKWSARREHSDGILTVMKFFISAAKDAAQAEQVYEAICKFNIEQLKATLSPQRIYSVSGAHESRPFTATVGDTFERLGEIVVAILFDTERECYLICTANRGVARDIPYLSGHEEIMRVEYFED